jgi:hypothetical protein
LLKTFLKENAKFFSGRRASNHASGGASAVVIAFLVSKDLHLTSVTIKFSKAFCEVVNGRLAVVPGLRNPAWHQRIIESFLPDIRVRFHWLLAGTLLRNLPIIVTTMIEIKRGHHISDLVIDDVPVGVHLYDSLLLGKQVATIDTVTLGLKLRVLVELVYYFCAVRIIQKFTDPIVILPDNTYRQGMVFEYLRSREIRCLAGLNINELTIYKYRTAREYENFCRTPSFELIDRILKDDRLREQAECYLMERISGGELHHDAIRAFDPRKKMASMEMLVEKHGVDVSKPIVLVAAHVFSDAPHAYPNQLYQDYQHWIIATCRHLKQNTAVNFVVKEHPSAALYKEEGLTEKILASENMASHLLSSDVNTQSLFNLVDVLVTCGGTAGMEFPCFGVPVVCISSPPYVHMSYVYRAKDKAEYAALLGRIHKLAPVSECGKAQAIALLFALNKVMRLDKNTYGFGTQHMQRDHAFDYQLFLGELIQDCESGAGYERLKGALHDFWHGRELNLIAPCFMADASASDVVDRVNV